MSPFTRATALTAIWIVGMLAAGALLVVGVVALSDTALRVAFTVLAGVTFIASLLLFRSPEPTVVSQESRLSAQIRTTSQLRTSVR